ncbi:14 kDa phosphohistidine phosphatase-like [Oopsacas minuta]|uniref:14 kDa phosphohistidine phosphatase-like n=1 Tax=Oopsacas minuta TaxID=111878 RepID=A0AAV7JT89_9METZ|nr:14 kDa phosphohistidine phosphatase-like [Oopsacas minuta]
MATSSSPIIPNIDIDEDGTFKYILIKIQNKSNPEPRLIVRGYKWAEFHADIFEKVNEELSSAGYDCECMGGGRIKHTPDEKSLLVYGYSVSYGRADHNKTVSLLQDKYSHYKSITFSNKGY